MRAFRWVVPLVPLVFASTARAERTETPQQLYKSGDSVTLPSIGATIVLPQAPAGWAVNLGIESNSNYDILRRQDPTNPALQVDFNRPKAPDCASIAKNFDKLIAAGLKLKRHDSTPFAPSSFERWGYELAFYQDKSVLKLCTNTPTGPVLAEINFQGALGTLDSTWVTPLLDEVGKAVNGSRGGLAGGFESTGQTTTLPLTGLPAIVPPGFNARIYTSASDGKQEDLIERIGGIYLAIMISKKPGLCALNASSPGAHFVYDPPYLPQGFQSKAVEITTANGTSIGVMCLQKNGYYVLASVGHAGSLADPEVMITKTILGPMGQSEAPKGGEKPDFGPNDEDHAPKNDKGAAKVSFELGYSYTSPSDGTSFEKSSGFSLALDAFSHSTDGPIGGAVELGVHAAFGSEGFLPLDAHFGLGPALVGRAFAIAPLVGVGIDYVGGTTTGADVSTDPLRVEGAGYYYFGGRIFARLAQSFGVDAYFTLHRRGRDDWDTEQRFGVGLLFNKYALGLRSTRFSNAADMKAGMTNFYFGFALF